MKNEKSDPLMGVKTFAIAGPMADRRQRCLGMTDEDRRWRAQWLKDQVLTDEEPRYVHEYYKDTTNVFRRLWKTPFMKLQKFLEPKVGHDAAFVIRHLIGKGSYAIAIAYVTIYFLKYHTNDFTTYRTVEVFAARHPMYPDDPNYPNYPVKKPSDYYDQGFYSSVLCQDPAPLPVEEESEEERQKKLDQAPCPKPMDEKDEY